ncbi:ribonuclease P protein component [Solitalea sp. MAHUQ-68]|uniref:Ribonuclease P protein component n=1 Tax=Solitalea agri TaxID=2953739 RepID=A0A9X2F5I1_9SPHI|nr:ribonuclease P protein component [Solitalea agri]MCO4292323.1 ribonuclease P protein component [Solitalea agri]
MNTFKKEERLCSKLLINELLQNGSSFLLYPFRIVWLPVQVNAQNSPAQILISVSKKRFKRANKRNRIKRLIKEAYRLNKQQLLYSTLSQNNLCIVFMCSYIGNDIFTFEELEKKLKLMLIRLSKETGKSLQGD